MSTTSSAISGFIALIGLAVTGTGIGLAFGVPSVLIYVGILLVAFAHVVED